MTDTQRPNELSPDLLTVIGLNSWPGHISSSRLQMFGSHITQCLPVKDATDRRCFTGMESKFGQYTFGVTLNRDARIIKVIDRYNTNTIGVNKIKKNPERVVIYESERLMPDGRMSREVDYLSLPSHHALHQHFGFKLNYVNNLQEHMPEGTVIAQSPNISPQGNYRYGLEAEVAMMSVPQITEDGVVASESFCKRMETTGVETFTVSWGKKHFPLNLYGDHSQYKIFPDIGDTVREDGILLGLRGYDEDIAPVTMSQAALQTPDFKYDQCTYVKAGAKVIDVKVQHDTRLNGIIRGKNLNTPVGMTDQTNKYLSAERVFYQSVLNEYKRLYGSRRDSLRISPKFHRLLVEAQAMTATGQKQRMVRTYRGAPIDEWRVEITIEYPIIPTIGFKLSGTGGDKGVIVDVRPDEDMPVDAAGNRAELIMDGLSTIKRMNPSRLIEQYINACSRDLTKKVRDLVAAKAPHTEVSELLLRYYDIVNPQMRELVTDDKGLITTNHLDAVLKDGIYLWVPTNNQPETMDIIRQLRDEYPAVLGPVTYRGMSGEMVTTKTPTLIGSMYILLLEKTGRNWAGVSSSKLSHFGVPAKLTTADRYSSPGRNQPIRFGESEGRLFVSTVGGKATAELFDRTNNTAVRRHVQEQILRSEQPTNIQQVVDRDVYPSGQGRVLQIIRHIGECTGWMFKRAKTTHHK